MRAATYARVSTQEQADTGTSLDTQRDRTRAYVDAQGWELVAEYVDEGVSGAADRRPDLDRLMGECRDGNVDVIRGGETRSLHAFQPTPRQRNGRTRGPRCWIRVTR